jgi:hypothetical protein
MLLACLACAADLHASDNVANETVHTAARGAHFGRALCGFTAAHIAQYKAKLKASLSDATDFDFHWDYGWTQEERELLQYQSLRVGDPQEYASRVESSCNRLRYRIKQAQGAAPAGGASRTEP